MESSLVEGSNGVLQLKYSKFKLLRVIRKREGAWHTMYRLTLTHIHIAVCRKINFSPPSSSQQAHLPLPNHLLQVQKAHLPGLIHFIGLIG